MAEDNKADTPEEVFADDGVDVMTRHFREHPENKAADVRQVVLALLGAETPSSEAKEVVKKAILAADHPLKKDLDKVLSTL